MATFESQLSVNEAGLLVEIHRNSSSYLWGQAVECYKCNLEKITKIDRRNDTFYKFATQFTWNIAILDENDSILCQKDNVVFGDHGIYQWNYSNNKCLPLSEMVPPINPLLPIFVMETLFVTWAILRRIYMRYFCESYLFQSGLHLSSATSQVENDLGVPEEANDLITPSSSYANLVESHSRIRSLDVFRGFAISCMIFVNYGGGEYWFMEHSVWNGITFADFVFPWFAWIMGFGVATKVKSELRSGVNRTALVRKLVYRASIMILVGEILANLNENDVNALRIPGVLQRLGISYLVVSVLEAVFNVPQSDSQDVLSYRWLEEVASSWKQWSIISVLVIVHACITFLFPVPECGAGYLGPGGLSEHSKYYNCTGGAAGYIDRLVLGVNHVYNKPTCLKLYKCVQPYDPEGLLGILHTVLCIQLGLHAARILQIHKSVKERFQRWLICSFILIFLGCVLCNFSINDGMIPINKNMWSLSYVLVTCGSAYFIFLLVYILVDTKKWWSGSPFFQTGMNSILLYIGHTIFRKSFPWQWKPFYPTTHAEYLVMDIWATFLWISIAVTLYKRKIFIVLS